MTMSVTLKMQENEVEMVWSCKMYDESSVLRRVIELEVEGRRPVGRSKKTWSKVMEEVMRKLNIMEGMAEDRKQWR